MGSTVGATFVSADIITCRGTYTQIRDSYSSVVQANTNDRRRIDPV